MKIILVTAPPGHHLIGSVSLRAGNGVLSRSGDHTVCSFATRKRIVFGYLFKLFMAKQKQQAFETRARAPRSWLPASNALSVESEGAELPVYSGAAKGTF